MCRANRAQIAEFFLDKCSLICYVKCYNPKGFDRSVRGFLRGNPAIFYKLMLRTRIYIDGFNLYYGALKGTKYKWLDLESLFCSILKPHCSVEVVNFYTARVANRSDDPSIAQRQDTYFRVLKTYCPKLRIIEGHFQTQKKIGGLTQITT